MTDRAPDTAVLLKWIRRLLIGNMLGVIFVLVLLLAIDYNGRVHARDTNIARCVVVTSNNLANIRATLQAAEGADRRGATHDALVYREAAAWLADSSGITPADVNLTDPLRIVQRFTLKQRTAYCEKARPKEPLVTVDL
jgi:hypothetical protein